MNVRSLLLLMALPVWAQPVETVRVVSKQVERKSRLPGEFLPYQEVALHARVTGYVEKVEVDRGSVVRKGQTLVELSAPEMNAQLAEAKSKARAAEAQKAEAEARAIAAQSTAERLEVAAKTPGAISGNELVQARKAVDAVKAQVAALEGSIQAAQAAVTAIQDLQQYLRVTAPFDGVITERFVHPGALASSSSGPLLKLEQTTRLRLVVAVPETEAGAIPRGGQVTFTVPAFPGERFSGPIARQAHSIDPRTRTEAVELDVANPGGRLAPGMYPEVSWPVRRGRPSVMVPPAAVVTTTERVFVIRVRDGKVEWVNVRKGAVSGDLVEVIGEVHEGDEVVKRGSDEIREGTRLTTKHP